MRTLLVTGAAGFIGFHFSKKLLDAGHRVFGVDNLNDYYSPKLKEDRLSQLTSYPNFVFQPLNLADREATAKLFADHFLIASFT